jgi:hypothetical protein
LRREKHHRATRSSSLARVRASHPAIEEANEKAPEGRLDRIQGRRWLYESPQV